MKKKILVFVVLLLAFSAEAARIECITATTTSPGGGLSSTAIEVGGRDISYNLEIFSTADATEGAPATCGGITCAGWDGASAQIWIRCDRSAPWTLMENTSTYTSAAHIARSQNSDCQIRLRVTVAGGGNYCLYLAATGSSELGPDSEVQDGSSKGSWAKVIDEVQ